MQAEEALGPPAEGLDLAFVAYISVETHQIAHFEYVHFAVRKLSFDKSN